MSVIDTMTGAETTVGITMKEEITSFCQVYFQFETFLLLTN